MRRILVALALAMALTGGSATAAPIVLTNQGFETGTLAGWNSSGSVVATPSTSVTTYNSVVWSILAAGTTMAHLDSNPQTMATIETFLGIPSGTLQANAGPNSGSLTDGSAIYQDFAGNAGDSVSMYFNYVARDYIQFNDPAFAVVVNPDNSLFVGVLASIWGAGIPVGTSGNSGWNLFQYVLPQTGSYRLAFVSANDKDQVLDAALFLDNVAGSCDPNCPPLNPVPEPASLLLLGTGLVGLGRAWRKRRS